MPIDEEEEEADDRLPASMADLFFALVAIVIFLLLALAPSIGAPTGPPPEPDALWRSDIRIGGREASVLLAEAGGLRLIGPPERRASLDAVLDDAAFGEALRTAARERPLVLAIEEDGQEAAFLFDALATSLDLGPVHQLRIDGRCAYIAAADLKRLCTPAAAGAARR